MPQDTDTFSFCIDVLVAPECEGINLISITTCFPPPQIWKYGSESMNQIQSLFLILLDHLHEHFFIRHKKWYGQLLFLPFFHWESEQCAELQPYFANLNFNQAPPQYVVIESRKAEDVMVDIVANGIPEIEGILVLYVFILVFAQHCDNLSWLILSLMYWNKEFIFLCHPSCINQNICNL